MSRIVDHAKHGLIFKAITVKIIGMAGERVNHRYHCEPGRWFTETSVSEILDKEEERLRQHFPMVDWKLIELAHNRFNLVAVAKEQETALVAMAHK